MEAKHNYLQDLAEIRTMMERSSKFQSLSGLAGVLAGVYALAGTFIAVKVMGFVPEEMARGTGDMRKVCFLAVVILFLAVTSAIVLSGQKARERGERAWSAISRRFVGHMAVPLVAGGILAILLMVKGLTGLAIPVTLIFYGLAFFNASKFTYGEVKFMGIILIVLGLAGVYFTRYGLLLWALGFGFVNIAYGCYLHFKYER